MQLPFSIFSPVTYGRTGAVLRFQSLSTIAFAFHSFAFALAVHSKTREGCRIGGLTERGRERGGVTGREVRTLTYSRRLSLSVR